MNELLNIRNPLSIC